MKSISQELMIARFFFGRSTLIFSCLANYFYVVSSFLENDDAHEVLKQQGETGITFVIMPKNIYMQRNQPGMQRNGLRVNWTQTRTRTPD